MGERAGDTAKDVLTTGTWRATPSRPAISGFGTSKPLILERVQLTEVKPAAAESRPDPEMAPDLEVPEANASGDANELLDDPDGQPDGEPEVKKDGPPVNRDVKLAVLLGFCAIVAVGVLVAEHFSKARSAEPATTELGTSTAALPQTPASTTDPISGLLVPNTTDPQASTARPSIFEMGRPAVDVEKGLGITLGPSESAPTLPQMTTGLSQGLIAPIVPVDPTPTPGAGGPGSAVVVVPEPSRPSGVTPIRRDGDTFLPGDGAGRSGGSMRPEMTVPDDATTRPGQPELVKDGSHPVKAGDTLDKIARQHYSDRTLAKALGEYNKSRIAKDGTLRAGVTLRIPPVAVLRGGERPAALASPARRDDRSGAVTPARLDRSEASGASGSDKPTDSAKPNAPKFYTVRRGDTLMDIAKETLGSSRRFRELQKANPGLDENNLKVGMKIRIPQASGQ